MTRLKIRLPEYAFPRNKWRKKIYDAINKKLYEKGERKIKFIDVDNRLKDVMDALQARWGGKISKNNSIPLIENDNTIYKVTVEKRIPPWQSKGLGHLIIQRMK